MALSDPLGFTISGSAKNVPKIDDGRYRLVDGLNTYSFDITTELPAKNKRNRIRAALKREALVSIPEVTGQSAAASLTVAVTADYDRLHTPADANTLYTALLTWLTPAIFLRIAGGET